MEADLDVKSPAPQWIRLVAEKSGVRFDEALGEIQVAVWLAPSAGIETRITNGARLCSFYQACADTRGQSSPCHSTLSLPLCPLLMT